MYQKQKSDGGWCDLRGVAAYATEAAGSVLDHALNTLRLRQVIADIDPRMWPLSLWHGN
jgi:hypothetical protein